MKKTVIGKSGNLVKPGLVSLLNRGSIAVLGFAGFFILVRILPKEQFGSWVLFISIGTILESIRKAFLYNPLIKYLNSSIEKDSGDIVASSFLLNIISALASILFLWVSSGWLSDVWDVPDLSQMLKIYCVGQLVFTLTVHFNTISEAKLSFLPTLISSLLQRVFFISCLIYFYVQDIIPNLGNLTYLYVTGMIVSAAVATFFGWRQFPVRFTKVGWLSRHFHFGKYTFGTNISSMLFKNTDTWMLGALLSNVSVAVYNPAIRISNLFEVPLGAISSVAFPNMVKQIKENGLIEAKRLYEQTVGFSLALMVPFVLLVVIFAEEIVLIVAGPDYLESVAILQVTMFYGLLLPFNRQFGITMNAIGMARINFIVLVSNASLNVLLNYFFILSMGVLGAAYATFISYGIILVVSEIILYRKLGVKMGNILRSYLKSHVVFLDLISRR
jgi:O-antigen/teichoic acid export membrane protein